MGIADQPIVPILLFFGCVLGLAVVLLAMGNLFSPRRPGPVKKMPYESGMDPVHDTRRRFDVRFYLLAIAFLVFDVELLFLYPWAVTVAPARVAATVQTDEPAPTSVAADAAQLLRGSEAGERLVASRHWIFVGTMVFVGLLVLGFVYDWRKGVFRWR